MVTSSDCVRKYGKPDINMERQHMTLWDVPADINRAIPEIPNKIYCNKDLVAPLEKALRNLIARGLEYHIMTWDGCFNIRKKKGGISLSLHSWGIAIDFNAAWNGFGAEPQMPLEVVKCFTDAGFDWGGTWTKKDGMHFQLSKI